jgi:hypothetical protein
MKNYIFLFCILFAGLTLKAQTLTAPEGLICELLRNPAAAVITDSSPEFGWIFPQSGIEQSAYRILVASSPNLLKEKSADLWDSKKTGSNNSVSIIYGGKELKDNSTYWWQVKVWSKEGLESSYSVPQQFNTGNFDRSDVDYPGESKWIELSSNNWVSEDKQRAGFERFEPVNISRSGNGSYFVEFEKSVIGILEFTATAVSDNTPISVYLGERKNDNQTVNKNPGRSNIGYQQIDMILKKGTHSYIVKLAERKKSHYLHTQKLAPHYPDVIPFLYAEITGDQKQFSVSEFKQAALFYFNDESASAFECSDEKLKIVWDLCKYTQKSTPFLGVYADGNRERMPYEADANIQQMSHFSVDREYSIAKYTINFLLDHASWPTEWQMHMVLMAWDYYMQTGDDILLRDRYEDLKRKSLIAFTDDSGLISTRTGKKTEEFLRTLNFPGKVTQFRDIVDWPQGAPKGKKNAGHQSPMAGGETDGYVYTDYNTVVNAFHYRTLVLMGKIAEVVGNKQDQQFFNKRSKEHKKIFLATFFNKKKGVFKDGESTDHSSLHANMFPMAFGMVPEKDIKSVSEFIKSRGMACSVYGSQYLLEALYYAGEAEHALKLMTSDCKRSWLNMISVGSSMTTEAWDESFKPNLTWNHAWGSAPANITARKLMGIEPLEPTFSKFRISPQPANLSNASIEVPCIRGSIKCDLINDENQWQMNISVPGNSKAEIWIPVQFKKVHINGEEIEPKNRIQFAGESRNIYSLESGIFSISAIK